MPILEVKAHAKLNLTLDILRRRGDGYHDLRMVMQSVHLADTLRLTTETGRGLQVATNLRFLPNSEKNLAAAAALRFDEATGQNGGGIAIQIQKNIPVCAGLAGGSSDGAAVLRGLNELTGLNLTVARLAEIGERVGSDVPYCVMGGTALAEGRGERLVALPPLPRCHVVLCKPGFSVSTPELFARVDCTRIRHRPDTDGVIAALGGGDLAGVARRMYNVFEDVLHPRHGAQIMEIKKLLIGYGALGASMSGTGPTVFGLFDDETKAKDAFIALKDSYRDTFFTETV